MEMGEQVIFSLQEVVILKTNETTANMCWIQYFAVALLFTSSLLSGNCDGNLEEIGFFHLKWKELD